MAIKAGQASGYFTQADIAEKISVSRNQITALKNKNNGPIGEIKIRKMCKMMDVEFDDYFEKTDNKVKQIKQDE